MAIAVAREDKATYSPNTRVKILAGSHRGKDGVVGGAKPDYKNQGKIEVLVGCHNKSVWCKREWLQPLENLEKPSGVPPEPQLPLWEQEPPEPGSEPLDECDRSQLKSQSNPQTLIETTTDQENSTSTAAETNTTVALESEPADSALGGDAPVTVIDDVLDGLNPVPEATPGSIVLVLEPLTPEEESERHRLELKVERAFYEAGVALLKLRDLRLYRNTHKTFEEYCRDRFGYNRSRPYQLIDAAIVIDNLSKCPQFVDKLPINESQCRPLTELEPEEQRQAWGESLEQTNGKRPTGRVVKGIVEQIKAKPLIRATDLCKKDQVFTLTGLSEQERKYNGYWAIATVVNEFSVEVDVHDRSLTVKPDNLKPIDSPQECRELPALLKRIKRLRERELDRVAYTILESLGRQTYLTDLENKVLTFLEQQYGIVDILTALKVR